MGTMRPSVIETVFSFLLTSGLLFFSLNIQLNGQTAYKEVGVQNGGTISGIVQLDGKISAPESFPITKNPEHCGISKPSDRLVVGKNNGVRNAIISVEGIAEGKKFAPFTRPVLDQKKCEYFPHVQVLPLGSELDIVNSDEILHNVHAYAVHDNYRTVCNIAQPIKGQKTAVKHANLSKPALIFMTCDAGHPWMSAYVFVAEHPYYTITDGEGKFEISDIPPGSYKIKMWHEGVMITSREMEKGVVKKYYYEDPYVEIKEIVVLAGKKSSVKFEFSLRKQM
jgi:hypothetical protein